MPFETKPGVQRRPALLRQLSVLSCALLLHGLPSAVLARDKPARAEAGDAPRIMSAQGTQQAAFAPWDDIEGLIVENLNAARKQVLVQAYLLTNQKITDALIAAHKRDVDVRVLMDGGQLDKNSTKRVIAMREAGIGIWLETLYRSAHNKVIVIDPALPRATVITGSFNFTWSAQHKNAENILVLRDNPALAASYAANWQRHRQDAQAYP
ncbi:phospholipase D family protein [Herbaspirillum lusitanum]|uniref:phospholipase D n=1 Tax=Herbaspirillum lusitanum TaxID=213312 RepID=A0ABW9AE56_9BURK